ncbi:MAG TPA: hypothetical protein VLN90_01885 [Thioalkalivibrio sp.]|nr:hypothetical protein [Thioalkalivibrio sp.]
MIIDSPVVIPPNAPPNRLPVSDRPGGGTTAVPTETLRALNDPEQGAASRRNEEQANAENRPGRNDADLASRARLDVAREQSREEIRTRSDENDEGSAPEQNDRPPDSDTALSREQIQQLRDRLEARLATQTPGATLRSVDEAI